ncbi:MAG: type II toxin-antitoxin system prevent-host-death family antitoxin [Chitinivibrionales bacterium]|nr:type II toxin-antitoxin system prevent-host-death family antitoxin [Chitinivibrionales bacterium]MBD3396368.1 type II toxin-antitoxin system prevent-host-death family antitoxin [Chitinivibrionales bacterium]
MIETAISEFRAPIQKYLNSVSKGEEVIVTSRGQETAKVTAPESKTAASREKLKKLSTTAVIKNITDPISIEWKTK